MRRPGPARSRLSTRMEQRHRYRSGDRLIRPRDRYGHGRPSGHRHAISMPLRQVSCHRRDAPAAREEPNRVDRTRLAGVVPDCRRSHSGGRRPTMAEAESRCRDLLRGGRMRQHAPGLRHAVPRAGGRAAVEADGPPYPPLRGTARFVLCLATAPGLDLKRTRPEDTAPASVDASQSGPFRQEPDQPWTYVILLDPPITKPVGWRAALSARCQALP